MRIENKVLVTAQAMTGNITSLALDLTHMGSVAVHARWSGTPTGSLKLQASVDGTNYIDLGASYTSALSGSAGSVLWQLADVGFTSVQVLYVFTSGTGVLDAVGNAKGF